MQSRSMQSRWRFLVLGLLSLTPILILLGFGFYYLWISSYWLWFWVGMIACYSLAIFLAWRWQAGKRLLTVDFDAPLFWTDKDKQAWKLVEDRAREVAKIDSDKLTDFNHYADTAKEMAMELAQFYHPKAKDPVSSLTIPEILAVVELASHDLAEMVQKYFPGGHLLTINNLKQAKTAVDYYQKATNVYWAVSAVFAPVSTAMRYAASRMGIGVPMNMLQQNLLVWFYTAYIHRLGNYLIDVNSGRLRVGAERYREHLQKMEKKDPVVHDGVANQDPNHITLTLVGQVKSGKSCLINALLEDQQAKTSTLPETEEVTRFSLQSEDYSLILQDTPGYGQAGPEESQRKASQKAAQSSDLILLVMRAPDPGRQADLEILKSLREYFESLPHLKFPKVVGVLTHIDLLSPKMEWDPPYKWQTPSRPKEQNIEQAVGSVREQLGDYLVGVIPVRADAGKVYGIQEELLPALTGLLGESRAVAMLRCLNSESEMGKYRKVFDQVLAGGSQVVKALWEQQMKR